MTDTIDSRWNAARPQLVEAARSAGIDVGVMVKIAGFESGFSPDARPIARDPGRNTVRQFDGVMAISSAHGYGQFLNSTWADMIRRHGEPYGVENAATMTNSQANAAELRANPRLQAAMLAELTRENIELGALLGGPNADANVYALHNLGQGDGTAFLNALRNNPDHRVDSVLSAAVIRGNPALYGDGSRSVAAAYQVMGQHMDRYERFAAEARRDAPDQTQVPMPSLLAHTRPETAAALFDGLLRQGERGDDIRGLQQSLNQLGVRDARGRALAEDGDFGQRTREAVEALQRANGLKVDGIAGPDTLRRIGQQLPGEGQVTATAEIIGPVVAQPRTLADPGHPDHALYRQAYDRLRGIDPQRLGFRSEQELRNTAGTLAFEARVSGLSRIDRVVVNRDGSGLFALQGRMDDPTHHRIYLDRAQAATQPLERSTQQIEQERLQQPEPARQPEREQRQIVMM